MTDIQTERLTLRRLRESDTPRVYECIQDPRIHRNVGTIPPDQSFERTRERIVDGIEKFDAGTAFTFAVTEDGERVIGMLGGSFTQYASFDFGYWIAPEAWGKGYATEASQGLMNWIEAEHSAKAFTAGYIQDNPASGRVLSKLGLMHAGRSRYFVQGRQEWCWSCDMAKII